MSRYPLIVTVFFAVVVTSALSQTRIGGIVNSYAGVTAISLDCQQTVDLNQPLNFLPSGTRVLIIQMKGASADAATGAIIDRGGAGTFEYATVAQAVGTRLVLAAPLRNSYNVAAAVQVVTVPRYTDAIVTSTLRAAPWNGSQGGVLALDVARTLTLEANIDAGGCGFRGGRRSVNFSAQCGFDAPFVDMALGVSGERGEGLSASPPPQNGGRAPWAGGGGGGADVNGGGGGGGGAGAGGNGGYHVDTCGLPRTAFGIGGDGVDNPRNSVALIAGGGGGGGHQNNGIGTDGAPGGGVVIVRAGTLVANGNNILAHGQSATEAVVDGGGGGGGGGSILLEIGQILGNPTMSVAGGAGGTCDGMGLLHGPGGGGGGGRIIYANQRAPVGVTNVLRGGVRGGNRGRPSISGDHGSQDGAAGSLVLLALIPLEPAVATSLTAVLPADAVVCSGTPIDITMTVRGGYPPYRSVLTNRQGDVLATNTSMHRITAVTDSVLVLTVTDSVGCSVSDTMRIVVENRAALVMTSVDMGTFICERSADTAVVIFNPSRDAVTVRSIDVQSNGTIVSIPTLPLTIVPGASLRIPVHLVLPAGDGNVTATIRLTSTACTPVMEATVVARVTRPRWQSPPVVNVPTHVRCAGPPADTTITIVSLSSGEARITADTAWIDAPFSIVRTGDAEWRVAWLPTADGPVAGVMTVVLRPCGDTVRIPVQSSSTQRTLQIRGGGRLDVATERVDVVVENTGTAVAMITQVEVSDPAYVVDVGAGGMPRALAAGQQMVCTVLVANPAAPAQALVTVRSQEPCDTSMSVPIERRRGVEAGVWVTSATAAPNERVDVSVVVDSVRTNIAPLLQRWQATVVFDGNSVVPAAVAPPTVQATWRREGRTLAVDLNGPWTGNGVVATLTLQTLLAHPPRTPIAIDTTVALWPSLPGDVLDSVEYRSGTLDLTGSICDRTARIIALRGIEGSLTVYDLLGRVVHISDVHETTNISDVLGGVRGGHVAVLRTLDGNLFWQGLLPRITP